MANKVLLILVDGMRPDAISTCGTPEFEALLRSGTYTFHGKTVFPPVTLPCHVSLFHSVDPTRHGTYTNTYAQQVRPIDGLIEHLAAEKKTSAFFYTWEQLRDLCTPGKHLSFSWFMSQTTFPCPEAEHQAAEVAKHYIQKLAPDFAFLYLGNTDEAGHDHGWMSPEYLDAVKSAYEEIRDVLDTLPKDYVTIITADHGGHDRNHGINIPEDMTIPISFLGGPFAAGRELDTCSILDLTPTIADLIGIAPDEDWEGTSILRREETSR